MDPENRKQLGLAQLSGLSFPHCVRNICFAGLAGNLKVYGMYWVPAVPSRGSTMGWDATLNPRGLPSQGKYNQGPESEKGWEEKQKQVGVPRPDFPGECQGGFMVEGNCAVEDEETTACETRHAQGSCD